MDVSLLKPDEIEIELEVRGICSGSPEAFDSLIKQVDDERVGTIAVPSKMHLRASKRPDLEIEACRSKVVNIQQNIAQLKDIPDDKKKTVAHRISSRLMHVYGRLERASKSPTYKEIASQVLIPCRELITSLQIYLKHPDKLNDSIEASQLVEIEQLPSMPMLNPEIPGDGLQPPVPSPGYADEINVKKTESKVNKVIPDCPVPSSSDQSSFMMTAIMTQLNEMTKQIQLINQKQTDLQSQIANQASISETYGTNPNLPSHRLQDPSRVRFQEPLTSYGISTPTRIATSVITNPGAATPSHAYRDSVRVSTSPLRNPANIQHNSTFISKGEDQDLHREGQAFSGQISNSYPNGRYRSEHRPLYRSGISYSGCPKGITVDMFFFQLETVASSMHLSAEVLMCEMHSVLKDVALQWFWTYRKLHPVASWTELKRDFIERFKDRRTNFEIRRTIETRKQKSDENFLDFYQTVWNLSLQCHTPYNDQELIQILMSNMSSSLQYQLTDRRFENINELIKTCTAWEETFKRMRSQSSTLSPYRRTINELQLQECGESLPRDISENSGPQQYIAALQTQAESATKSKTSLTYNNRPSSTDLRSQPVCFNCSDIGHTFMDCPIPPTGIFCYRCGLKGTISSRCSRCAGNAIGGSWRSGNQAPPKTLLTRPRHEDVATNTDPELSRRTPQNLSHLTR